MSGPKLWGQLPIDLLSKILKVEKDRLDEIAMNEWNLKMTKTHEEFQKACEESVFWGGDLTLRPASEIIYHVLREIGLYPKPSGLGSSWGGSHKKLNIRT
jgi:hypothetical protein